MSIGTSKDAVIDSKLKAAKSTVERVSTTGPDARVMKQAEGGSASCDDVQMATDAAHSLIVDLEATQAGNDYRQLTPAVDRIKQHLDRRRARCGRWRLY